jgi:threonine aldolase
MRYLAAQFLGLLEDGLWLRNAAHANLMARRLADGIRGVPGVDLWQAVESNAVFASLGPDQIERLQREWEFYVWDEPAHVARWMTAFDTTEADVDAFAASVRAMADGS